MDDLRTLGYSIPNIKSGKTLQAKFALGGRPIRRSTDLQVRTVGLCRAKAWCYRAKMRGYPAVARTLLPHPSLSISMQGSRPTDTSVGARLGVPLPSGPAAPAEWRQLYPAFGRLPEPSTDGSQGPSPDGLTDAGGELVASRLRVPERLIRISPGCQNPFLETNWPSERKGPR